MTTTVRHETGSVERRGHRGDAMSSLRRVLRGGDFRRLLIGQGVSGLGDWMATFALMALAWEVTSSTSAVGGILTLRLLPAALGGTVAARVSLRWDRRRTMLATDLLRLGIVAIIPLIAQLWWIYLWAFVLEAASVIFLSARDAAVPELAEADDLPTANSLMLGSSFGSIPVGAGAFAVLTLLPFADEGWLASRPHAVVFWIDALTYLVSALLIARMAPLGRPVADSPSTVTDVGRLRDAAQIPLVRTIMPAAAAVALGLGALFSLGLSLVRVELEASTLEFGVLIAIFGVGAGAGTDPRDPDERSATGRHPPGYDRDGRAGGVHESQSRPLADLSGRVRLRPGGDGCPHLGDDRPAVRDRRLRARGCLRRLPHGHPDGARARRRRRRRHRRRSRRGEDLQHLDPQRDQAGAAGVGNPRCGQRCSGPHPARLGIPTPPTPPTPHERQHTQYGRSSALAQRPPSPSEVTG